jgi:hypothetical protein
MVRIARWLSCCAAGLACLVLTLSVATCGGSAAPTTPTSPPVPSVTPTPTPTPEPTPTPPTPNAPPTIKAVFLSNDRVEADGQIDLAADVQDDVTPIDQLAYEWTSDKGTGVFIGTGRQVKWQAPHLKPTPDVYVLTLTVIERYTSGGETKENRTSSSVTVHYNDSYKEIRDMTLTFLGDFSTYSTSPEACVRNFSDSCPGKWDELSDIQTNRAVFKVQSGTYSIDSMTLDPGRTVGTSSGPCTFVSTVKATGKTETATGQCVITGTYDFDRWRWFLCQSNFDHGHVVDALKGPSALTP